MIGLIELLGMILGFCLVILFMVVLPVAVVIFLAQTVRDRREHRKFMEDRELTRARVALAQEETYAAILKLPKEEQDWWKRTYESIKLAEDLAGEEA